MVKVPSNVVLNINTNSHSCESLVKSEAPEVDTDLARAQYNEVAYNNWDNNILETCMHCQRTFHNEQLVKH